MVATIEQQVRRMTPVSAPPEQLEDMEALQRLLDRASESSEQQCELVGPDGARIGIPEAVFRVLERVVEVMARGDAITVVPVGKELTTQQAANLLNVSRQYLVRLLDDGRIAHRKTGRHRRVLVEDVLSFKRRRDRERRSALRELTELSEEYGGYSEVPSSSR